MNATIRNQLDFDVAIFERVLTSLYRPPSTTQIHSKLVRMMKHESKQKITKSTTKIRTNVEQNINK